MSKEMTLKEAFRRIEISLSDYLGEGLINERKMIRQALTELEELKRKLPNLLKLAIEMGYGVVHEQNVDKQEEKIVKEILSKVGEK